MLKYFKKQKGRVRRNSSRDDDDSSVGKKCGDNAEAAAMAANNTSKRNSLRSTSSFCDEVLLAAETVSGEGEEEACAVSCGGSVSLCGAGMATDDDIFRYHSRLAISLPAIVNEPNCLSYFVQYLEARDALSLLKFYLDTENFKAAALTLLERQQPKAECEKYEESKVPIGEQLKQQPDGGIPNEVGAARELASKAATVSDGDDDGEDVEEENSVPELRTLYDLSMRKPLTDDEKSQIYAETSKQIASKCCNNNNNSTNNVNISSSQLRASSELSLSQCSVSTSTTTEPDSVAHWPRINAASVNDAISIYQKYLIADAQQFVQLPVTILSQISLLLCNREEEATAVAAAVPLATSSMAIAPSCFDEAQQYVLEQLEREHLNEFLQSPFYCKYCVELIEGVNGQQLTIYDILYSEAALFFFMEFLEQRGERECLDYWTAAVNFRKSYAGAKDEEAETEAQSDAMIIYEKFFSLQSDNRLWMSDKLRSRVEERICAAGHVAYCFDLPLQVTAKYLEQKYFDDFRQSQLFANYVSELKLKLQDELAHVDALPRDEAYGCDIRNTSCSNSSFRRTSKGATGSGRHRKTLSDCTNASSREHFRNISQHNTLLAMDTSTLPAHLKNLHSSGTNMNIDSRQLTNPNLLWHRSTSSEGGLKFGRINALGRYERDFDSVDAAGAGHGSGKHSWSLSFGGSKLKNAMRRLVNLPEEKVQEEIAWQVAEMIVKDVTSITLNNSGANNGNANH